MFLFYFFCLCGTFIAEVFLCLLLFTIRLWNKGNTVKGVINRIERNVERKKTIINGVVSWSGIIHEFLFINFTDYNGISSKFEKHNMYGVGITGLPDKDADHINSKISTLHYKNNQEIDVIYLKNNPDNAQIKNYFELITFPLLMIGLGIFFICLGYCVKP